MSCGVPAAASRSTARRASSASCVATETWGQRPASRSTTARKPSRRSRSGSSGSDHSPFTTRTLRPRLGGAVRVREAAPPAAGDRDPDLVVHGPRLGRERDRPVGRIDRVRVEVHDRADRGARLCDLLDELARVAEGGDLDREVPRTATLVVAVGERPDRGEVLACDRLRSVVVRVPEAEHDAVTARGDPVAGRERVGQVRSGQVGTGRAALDRPPEGEHDPLEERLQASVARRPRRANRPASSAAAARPPGRGG